jgi:hypothetical protein
MSGVEFGVVIPAKEEHLHWVRGTCASVRHFMGDTPICVMLDGERFPDQLHRTYDIMVVRRSEIEPPELRAAGAGSIKAKNATLWASPFETFVSLDADTVVWGDLRELADFESADFVLDAAVEPARSVMDVDVVDTLIPPFDARVHVEDFANTGVYFARRGVLDLDRYLDLIRIATESPGTFYGSQGIFNLMVFEAADRGDVRVQHRELQVMTGRTRREDVVRRFELPDSGPAACGDPVVLHWVGSPKPRVRQRGRDYFEPMTYFRHEFRRAARGSTTARLSDDLALRLEDLLCTDWRGTNARGRLARLRRRARQRYARYKVFARARTPEWMVTLLRRPTSS